MISLDPETSTSQLAQGFKPRHVMMLSIAGVIGAGLFVGSGHAIAAAGPAAILAYLFSGLLVVLVMRMLGEMAVANPDTGSFSTYADQAIGQWAGFTIGWLYWWFWVLVTHRALGYSGAHSMRSVARYGRRPATESPPAP